MEGGRHRYPLGGCGRSLKTGENSLSAVDKISDNYTRKVRAAC